MAVIGPIKDQPMTLPLHKVVSWATLNTSGENFKIMIVRKMLPQEFDSTMVLVKYYIDEAGENMPQILEQYDENSVIDTIRIYASSWGRTWINLYDNSRPVGFIAGFITPCAWNKDILDANVSFIYVLDSHRNIDNLRELVKAFEEWSKTFNAKTITAGDMGINPERFQRVFESMGFKPRLLLARGVE